MARPRSRVHYERALEPHLARPAARLIPAVHPWQAGEMFVSPHVEERRRGFAILVGSDSTRRSPLTLQLLVARLDEADLELRAQITRALSDYFEIRGREYRYPAETRAALAGHLRKFDRPQLQAMLELQTAPADQPRLRPESLVRLLERIPAASTLLTRLASDRQAPLGLRRAAIEAIGQVGFTDAASPLEGLLLRLDGGRAGQLPMNFAPTVQLEEQQLVPALQAALSLLRDED